jgi:hypothetical protein
MPCLADQLIGLGARWVGDQASGLRARDGQSRGIEQTDLDQQRGLVTVDALERDPSGLEPDHRHYRRPDRRSGTGRHRDPGRRRCGRSPLHLLLGTDALRRAREKFDAVIDEIDRWEDVTRSTDFPVEA